MTKEELDAVVELRIAKAYRAYEEAKGVYRTYWQVA